MIKRLLVANRGEIARRVFATCRTSGIETVAVYSDADTCAPHVRDADYAVRLPGHAPSATYLRGDLLVAAALAAGADAIHPGYGFLSENAEFATAVLDAGLTWIGPPPKAIATMGSKLAAKQLLTDVGVPTLPSYPDAGYVDQFPVLVKASAGGGGRGMRVVRDPDLLDDAIAAASREAQAAFGDGTVFCEPYVDGARHIEVQIFADAHGNVIPFGERECSVQRRHQKLIEETPSPAVHADLREELCRAAMAAAQAVGYVGAGTVEFLLTPSGEFYFLEMNTRLQVEHPVTECVSGVDLVRLQLLVAEGGTLPYAGPPPMRGHAIEARLYAEDPANAWLPSTGSLHRFDIPGVNAELGPMIQPGLRLDSAVETGSTVGIHYDPMLAKLIAWAPSRTEAARLLSSALARAQIHGVVTNRDLLVRVLRHPAFGAGDTDTAFLDDHPEVFVPLASSMDTAKLSCLAAALAGAAARRECAPVLGGLPSGWRNVGGIPQAVGYDGPTGPVEVAYRFDRGGTLEYWSVRAAERSEAGVPSAEPALDAEDHPAVTVVSAAPDRVSLDVAGVRVDFAVHQVGDVSYVDSSEGSVTLTELPRFVVPATTVAPTDDWDGAIPLATAGEGSLLAPLPGAVGRVLVVPGQRVHAGELLLTLEAMKLEHPMHAPASGVVAELPVSAGTQVDPGTVLAVITPE
ncbi:MAG TPA: biotin carboxylase N-terminal domain-containing protein [Rugosimonospora sp.]|nr:biotin carboxylase N-terminal domain-containing protein [Rugosimonospora sp.]